MTRIPVLCFAAFWFSPLLVAAQSESAAPAEAAAAATPAAVADAPPVVPAAEQPEPAPSTTSVESPASASPIHRESEHPLHERRFGQARSIVMSGASSLSVRTRSYTNSSAYFTGVSLDPAADFFVSDHVSIGGSIHLGYDADRYYLLEGVAVDEKVTSLGIGPQVGYELVLGERSSWWLRAGIPFGVSWYHDHGVVPVTTQINGQSFTAPVPILHSPNPVVYVGVNLFAPLLFHPAPHFFVGIGPRVYLDVTRSATGRSRQSDETLFAIETLVGGWV